MQPKLPEDDVKKIGKNTGKMWQRQHVGLAGLHQQAASAAHLTLSAAASQVSTRKYQQKYTSSSAYVYYFCIPK